MKYVFLLLNSLIFLSFLGNAYAQPVIDWQRCYGTSSDEIARSFDATSDGGYILAGKQGNNVLVNKVDENGEVQWTNTYGGSFLDEVKTIIQTIDGGYALFGDSRSNDGDVSGNHSTNGGAADLWFLKLNQDGLVQFKRCYGGTANEVGNHFIQKPNGNFLLLGSTGSNDGQVTGNHGSSDTWLVEITETGDLVSQKCFGGTSTDVGTRVRTLANNNIGILSISTSSNFDVANCGAHGGEEYWMIVIDANSWNIIHKRCYGGSSWDDGHNFIHTSDGGFALIGATNSTNGNITNNHGGSDCWVIKTDASLNIEWQNCYGGTFSDKGFDIVQTNDGGYLTTSISTSTDGDVTDPLGSSDIWIAKLNYAGSIEWQKSIGGPGSDFYNTGFQGLDNISIINDQEFMIFSDVQSVSGDVSGNNGGYDMWLVKMKINSNEINGKLFYDLNTNGTYDTGDLPCSNKMVNFESGQATFTNIDGDYTLLLNDSGTYVVNAPEITYHTANPSSQSAYFDAQNSQIDDGNDFSFTQIAGNQDLRVNIYPITGIVKGFMAQYVISYENFGTETVNNASLVFNFPTELSSFLSASVIPDISSDSIVWNITAIEPYTSQNIYVQLQISPFSNTGTPYIASSYINPIIGDVNPANNAAIDENVIVAACDPNDIKVDVDTLTNFEVLDQIYLTYNVRFQNTGTAPAVNILILDTLPSLVDPSTFEFISATHNVELRYIASDGAFEFYFPDIMLADSTSNEPESHGGIVFKILLRDNAQIGDVIGNKVDIYFDFEPAVTTNTAETVIVDECTFNNNVSENEGVISTLQLADTYQWINCSTNEEISGATDMTYEPLTNGYYAVVMTTENCSFTSNCFFLTVSGIEHINEIDHLSVFPNPSSNVATVSNLVKEFDLEIYDTQGRLLQLHHTNSSSFTFNTESLNNGVYILKAVSKDNVHGARLIVQH